MKNYPHIRTQLAELMPATSSPGLSPLDIRAHLISLKLAEPSQIILFLQTHFQQTSPNKHETAISKSITQNLLSLNPYMLYEEISNVSLYNSDELAQYHDIPLWLYALTTIRAF